LLPDKVGAGGLVQEVVARPEEYPAIAARLAIPAVLSLSCRFRLSRADAGASGQILAEGELRARVVRTCVVSLDDFEDDVRENFRVRFVPAGTESGDEDPGSDDEIPYSGVIDLGEAAVEQLALDLDPYPRKPGATLPAEAQDENGGAFAALARLHRPPDNE
jgi:hypothetical protein